MLLNNLPSITHPLPWQDEEWIQLTAQFLEGRFPHALLLTGRKFIGKTHLALALSRLLLCARPESLLNCGKCHACQLSARWNHGDLRWVEPVENSQTIKIDQIREVVRFTGTKAGISSRKVIVITPVEKLNANAFNALLKSLEEPSENTHFILVCGELQKIPATIRSRCHLMRMATPAFAICLRWLNEYTSDPERSRSLLTTTGGLPLLAQQLCLTHKDDEYLIKSHSLESLTTGLASAAEVAQFWSEDDTGTFLEFLAANLQERIRIHSVKQLKKDWPCVIFDLLDQVYQLRRANSSGANPNKQLLLVALLSKYQRLLGTSLWDDNISRVLEVSVNE